MAIEALEDAQKSLDGQFSCGNCYTDVIQACKKALEQQEVGDAEIKQMLNDIEWYQMRVKELEEEQEPLNLNCKSVQKRLAIQWGYVEQPAMTYEQGFAHGYEAHRVEQELEQPAQEVQEDTEFWEKLQSEVDENGY